MYIDTTLLQRKNVFVMHDFFIDRILSVEYSLWEDRLVHMIRDKIRVGGGSIRGIRQYDIKGGNAVNLAYALGKFNAKCILVTLADEYGSALLKSTFLGMDNVNVIVLSGRQGYTLALEFRGEDGRVANVMLSDIGDNAYFGSDRLDGLEHLLSDASCIAVVNWASNTKGSELIEYAFNDNNNNGLHFLDPADISERREEFTKMLLSRSFRLDVLSINENEARVLASTMGIEYMPRNYSVEDVVKQCKSIASILDVRVDIHTPLCSASSDGMEVSYAETVRVDARISTGAGDVWDAMNIIGYLLEMNAYERLSLANAAAAYYVSNARVPKPEELYSWMRNHTA
jgi:ribokinase